MAEMLCQDLHGHSQSTALDLARQVISLLAEGNDSIERNFRERVHVKKLLHRVEERDSFVVRGYLVPVKSRSDRDQLWLLKMSAEGGIELSVVVIKGNLKPPSLAKRNLGYRTEISLFKSETHGSYLGYLDRETQNQKNWLHLVMQSMKNNGVDLVLVEGEVCNELKQEFESHKIMHMDQLGSANIVTLGHVSQCMPLFWDRSALDTKHNQIHSLFLGRAVRLTSH